MARRLEDELSGYGDLEPDEFRDVVQELKAVMFPSWSDEELLFHFEEEMPLFAAAVRQRMGCPELPGDLIARTLVNCRKSAAVA